MIQNWKNMFFTKSNKILVALTQIKAISVDGLADLIFDLYQSQIEVLSLGIKI